MSKKLSQRELDLESYERGRRRFYARIKVAMDSGRSSETGWGTLLTSAAIQPMTEHLIEMLPGETSVGATALKNLGLKYDRIALIALQSFMDGAAKSMTFSRVCIITAKTIQTEAILTAIRIKDKEKRLARYQQWVAHRTTQRRASELRKIVSRTFTDITNEFAWDDETALKVGYILAIAAIESTGLFERRSHKRGCRQTVVLLSLSEDAWEYAHKSMKHGEALHPIKMPMVVPPRKWSSPTDGGYEEGLGFPLVRGATKAATACHDIKTMPEVYAAINAVQHTPYRVNAVVLDVVQRLMETRSPIGDLDVYDDGVFPTRPPILDMVCEKTPEQRAEIRRYWHEANRVAENNRRIKSRRIGILQTISLASKFASEGDLRFFHAASLDFRGRFYCQSTGLSHQGNDLQKGLIEFGQGHVIPHAGEATAAWLRHAAACRGVKGTYAEREAAARQWVNSGEAESIAKDPLGTVGRWKDAADPFSFLAWCLDVPNVRAGKPSHLMVAVDGSCNGLQVLSLLLKDEVGGAAVNLVPSNVPADIYSIVAARTQQKIIEAAKRGDEHADQWAELGITRSLIKRVVMTVPYSISQRSAVMYLREAYFEQHRGGPWMDPSYPCGVLIKSLWPAISEICVGGMAFLSWAQRAAKVLVHSGIHPTWVTPDGFTVQQSYMNYDKSRVRTVLGPQANIWQIRKATARINRRKHIHGLVPNLVHSLDACAARKTALRLVAAGVPDMAFVHDSYLTHAAYAPVLNKELRAAWVDTFAGDPLGDWIRQINAQLPVGLVLPDPPPQGTLNTKLLVDAPYFFS